MNEVDIEVLSYINEYVDANGYPPCLREIVTGTRYASTAAVSYRLKVLDSRGYLHVTPKINRGLRVTNSGKAAIGVKYEML